MGVQAACRKRSLQNWSRSRIDVIAAFAPSSPVDIRNLAGGREAALARPLPNTNVMVPRTIVPMLLGRHQPGQHLLAPAVFATARAEIAEELWDRPPLPAGPWF